MSLSAYPRHAIRIWHQVARTQRYPDTIVQQRLALFIALIAVGLPLVLFFGTYLTDHCFRASISHHYYDPIFGTVFVGSIMFIGAFLLAYRGQTWMEKYPIKLAALGAFALAFVPTKESGCSLDVFASRAFFNYSNADPSQFTPSNGDAFSLFSGTIDLHSVGAGLLLSYLALYCLFVMTRTLDMHREADGRAKLSKRRRNRLYIACGIVILISVGLLAWFDKGSGRRPVWWDANHMVFWIESIALWAFGVAWTAKSHLLPGLRN